MLTNTPASGRFWNSKSCPMYRDASIRDQIWRIPPMSILIPTGRREAIFVEVIYRRDEDIVGWVYQGYLEPLVQTYRQNVVNSPRLSKSLQSEPRHIIIPAEGTIYNLCGEMCMAFISDFPLDKILDISPPKPSGIFNRFLFGGRARTTSIRDLVVMATTFPSKVLGLRDVFNDPFSTFLLITSFRFERLIRQGWKAVMSVRIEPEHGRLMQVGLPHWVVMNNVFPEGMHQGFVEIYNPFTNAMEMYSWNEFMTSMGLPMGLFVTPIIPEDKNYDSASVRQERVGSPA